MNKINFWQLVPYLLPILSYIIGQTRNRLGVPKSIQRLLGDGRVIEIVTEGIENAQKMQGKTDDEKREYVRTRLKSELHDILGEWLPDSAVNFLIEHTVVRLKAA